ncbi:opioid growth factor receptor-like protein 1 [Octopus sinensis]|uniref:Opioid growth factor receptor-like protein 1 n=1 Tax=Octopus sinensis TaxID=2607531 RepID=A0A6P7SCZ2_9MOLL|nr:opioid growth factor receptor-like protein 1 [Octopus sinensis]
MVMLTITINMCYFVLRFFEFFCPPKSVTDHQKDQTTVKLLKVNQVQSEIRPDVENQTEIRHSKDQVDIRQEQNQQSHQTEEDKSKIKYVECVTELRCQDQSKEYHQGQEFVTDYQEKDETKKCQHEEHQFETDYRKYESEKDSQEDQTKIYSQEDATKGYHEGEYQTETVLQEGQTMVHPQNHATKIFQENQIKTYPQKQESKTNYQEKPKTEKLPKCKKKKKRSQVHQTETYNQEAQTKTGSKQELSKFVEQNSKPESYDNSWVDPHPNLAFYKNMRKSEPDGDYIEDILKNWFGDYKKLERHHGYIQWLFPNRAAGLNGQAFCLNDYEIQEISKNDVLGDRVKRSFHLMLDFYGMSMNDDCQFALSHSYSDRIKNLKERHHNFLRITRILIALGEFGLKTEQRNWLDFLKHKVDSGILKEADYSLKNFWIPAVQEFELSSNSENINEF